MPPLNSSAGHHANHEDLARTWVEVDLDALERNLLRVATWITGGGRIILSAKKDAYGHGLRAVARRLSQRPEVGCFGLATVDEALSLREAEPDLPIMMFSTLAGHELREAIRAGIILTVTDPDDAGEADRIAAELGLTAHAHLKVDTGMGRLGRRAEEVKPALAKLAAFEHLRLESIYTHLADAWERPETGREQMERFDRVLADSPLAHLDIHWGGSDAGTHPEMIDRGQWLRSGIAVYGDHPGIERLEPAMTFKTRVTYRRCVPEGTAISYGGTHVTHRPTELALIGAGYGNGYLRSLSNCGEVLIRGRRHPILGRVCMDQCVVDVTEAPEVAPGDEVVLFGRQGEAVLPAGEVARTAGTISYELFCLAGQINPRHYVPAPA